MVKFVNVLAMTETSGVELERARFYWFGDVLIDVFSI